MPVGLNKYLEEIADKRVEELRFQLSQKNIRYVELKAQAYELQQKLMATLTEEQQGMLVKLEDLESAQEAIIHDDLYMNGFKDGLKCARLVLGYCPKDPDCKTNL